MASTITLPTAKQLLRKTIKARLKALPPALVASESAAVIGQVIASSWYQKAQSISIYLSTPVGEITTDSLVRDAFAQGKKVFVPFCPIDDPTVMRMLRLRDESHFTSLPLNRWGIRELAPAEVNSLEDSETAESGGLDLILVPGLAFDPTKRRLGHGRGYYDRFIHQTSDYPTRFGKPPPFTAALALSAQLLAPGEEIPTNDEWDRIPDVLFTPDGIIQ